MKRLLMTGFVLFLGCSFWDTATAAADGILPPAAVTRS